MSTAIIIEVRAEWYGAGVGFRELYSRMRDARKPLRKGMYEYMTTSVKERFDVGGKPRWKNRKISKPWPVLNKTGRLMRSVTLPTSTNKNIEHPSKHEITLNSKVPYAPIHDKERGYNPPNRAVYGRPFLEMTKKDTDIFLKILLKWSEDQAKKSFGNK